MIEHETVVGFAKSYGLFYLVILATIALVYALWPANQERFDRAANAILEDEDTPCL